MVARRREAARNARRYTTCSVGMCLRYVRTWLEIGSYYGSAIEAWRGASGKHWGDRTPPRGVPVFYEGGTYGHIALSMGHGKVRSTDAPYSGRVSTVDLNWPEQHWGQKYLGWTETLNGVRIPFANKPKRKKKGKK